MGETIKLKAADGFTFSAYVAGPANATEGVVVVQEIFGVNRHIRDMTDRFAAVGYAAVAPAVFDRAQRDVELGYTQADIDKGRELRMKLSDVDLMKDIDAAADHLAGKKLGIVGYCFGGTVAWWGATRTHKFAAAPCWYGGGIPGTKNESPNCPVQMHFGEKDASIPMSDVDAVRRRAAEGRDLRLRRCATWLRLRRARQLQQARLRAGTTADGGFFRKAPALRSVPVVPSEGRRSLGTTPRASFQSVFCITYSISEMLRLSPATG